MVGLGLGVGVSVGAGVGDGVAGVSVADGFASGMSVGVVSPETMSLPEAAMSDAGFTKDPASITTKKETQVAAKPISSRCVFFINKH